MLYPFVTRFDADGNGLLTLEEIKGAMRKLGTVMTHMEFKNIINELDTDGDKMLDLREVSKFIHLTICDVNFGSLDVVKNYEKILH